MHTFMYCEYYQNSKDVYDIQVKMCGGFNPTYTPNPVNTKVYNGLCEKYLQLGKTLKQQLREL